MLFIGHRFVWLTVHGSCTQQGRARSGTGHLSLLGVSPADTRQPGRAMERCSKDFHALPDRGAASWDVPRGPEARALCPPRVPARVWPRPAGLHVSSPSLPWLLGPRAHGRTRCPCPLRLSSLWQRRLLQLQAAAELLRAAQHHSTPGFAS